MIAAAAEALAMRDAWIWAPGAAFLFLLSIRSASRKGNAVSMNLRDSCGVRRRLTRPTGNLDTFAFTFGLKRAFPPCPLGKARRNSQPWMPFFTCSAHIPC